MNSILLALCFVTILGAVCGETCNDDGSSCSRERCDSNYQLACVKGECTCLVSACFTGQVSCHHHQDHCNEVAGMMGCRCNHQWHCHHDRCYCGGRT